jgi:hypothetical protein
MAERIKSQTTFSVEEILRTEVIVNQALINILIAKNIISDEDLIEGIRKIRQEQYELILKAGIITTLQKNE